MITTTTTTRSHRGRRVAAAVLVGLGLVSLGVASASHLTVEAEDLVASGVTTDLEGFLGPDATADVKVTYADVDGSTEADTLATELTLPPTVTVTIDPDGGTIPTTASKLKVYFYSDNALVSSGSVTDWSATNPCATGCTVTMSDWSTPLHYDRVAVVAVSGDYGN